MAEVFYWVLNMSIFGTLLGVGLLLLRRIKKLPRFFIYLLWSLVLIRFVCPVGFTSGFSFLSILPEGSMRLVGAEGASLGLMEDELYYSNFIQTVKSYQPFVLASDGLSKFYRVAGVAWSIVALAAILCNGILYLLARAELKKAVLLKENIYESSAVSMPLVFGIMKPRIILPIEASREEKQLVYLLAHERTHIRRHDNLWRMIAMIVACLHWFNPFVWICLKKFFSDMELACDEGTIRKFKNEDRKNYAYTLLQYTGKEFNVFTSAFGSSKVKVRIERVVTYKRLTMYSSIGLGALFVTLMVFLLSNR